MNPSLGIESMRHRPVAQSWKWWLKKTFWYSDAVPHMSHQCGVFYFFLIHVISFWYMFVDSVNVILMLICSRSQCWYCCWCIEGFKVDIDVIGWRSMKWVAIIYIISWFYFVWLNYHITLSSYHCHYHISHHIII